MIKHVKVKHSKKYVQGRGFIVDKRQKYVHGKGIKDTIISMALNFAKDPQSALNTYIRLLLFGSKIAGFTYNMIQCDK